MTEAPGNRTTRHRTGVVTAGFASVAGAVAAIGWAATSVPAAAHPPSRAWTRPPATSDPTIATLQRSLTHEQQSLGALRRTLEATIREQRSVSAASKAAEAAAAAAAQAAEESAPTAATAPAVHATTGASHG
jgi:hypothetical protein